MLLAEWVPFNENTARGAGEPEPAPKARLPTAGLSGTQLASLLQALGDEAALIREEVGVDETPEPDQEDTPA